VFAVHRRGRARAVVTDPGQVAEPGLPRLFAVPGVEAEDVLVVAPGADDVDLPGGDRGRGVTAAQALGLPQQLGAVPGPLLEQAGFGGDAGTVRAAPGRPVAGR